jgi:CDP-paratose 2-epimerase
MKIIITGGAGFIGSNAASRYLEHGHEVIIVDNLSRDGADRNLEWLRRKGRLEFVNLDVRDERGIAKLFLQHRDIDRVLHLAAQVAVTASVACPRLDFDINAIGTFNILEAMREARIFAPLIFSSTNKVYGEMTDLSIREANGRYGYDTLSFGVPETRNLDFHSPYGCSKGTADQYVLDYHRIYGLRTIVFRQSCIYGYRQMGSEDQGWVAWFMIAAHLGLPITIYGDGKQVRDVLFVDDLLDAYEAAFTRADEVAGRAYNIGGGPNNTLSLLELVDFIERRQHHHLPRGYGEWRPGDQKVFVSDIRRAEKELGWTPQVSASNGLARLHRWVSENQDLFCELESKVESPTHR